MVLRLFFILIMFLVGCSPEEKKIEKNPQVLKILELTNIKHDGSLQEIVDKTQKSWLRQKYKERWEIELEKFPEKRLELMNCFQKLNYLHTIKPKKTNYDFAILNGCSVTRYRKRLRTLVNAWNRGVRFKKLFILGGERPLSPKVENEAILYNEQNPYLKFKAGWKKPKNALKTEMDMLQYIYESSQIPDSLRQVPTVYVNTPMQRNASGRLIRPITPDTINKWLKEYKPPKGSFCLAISSQPYVGYQHAVLRTYLEKAGLKVETIGEAALPDTMVAIYLDSLGRQLYQENERRKATAQEPSKSLYS